MPHCYKYSNKFQLVHNLGSVLLYFFCIILSRLFLEQIVVVIEMCQEEETTLSSTDIESVVLRVSGIPLIVFIKLNNGKLQYLMHMVNF